MMTPRLLPTISLPLILLVEVHSQIPFVNIPFEDVKFDSFLPPFAYSYLSLNDPGTPKCENHSRQ
jgi:hypothetical protein